MHSCAGGLHQPARPIASIEAVSGATGDALPPPKRSMKKPPSSIPGLPRRLVAREGTPLFAFIRTLRLAVRASVAEDQSRGVPFAEIVIRVREMVSRVEGAGSHSGPGPSLELTAITKRAEAWCREAYQGPVRSV